MARVILTDGKGSPVGELVRSAEDILARAEDHAREHRMAKRSYFPVAVREAIEAAGYQVSAAELTAAMVKLDAVRSGAQMETVPIRVTSNNAGGYHTAPHAKDNDMSSKPLAASAFSRRSVRTQIPMPAIGTTGWLAWTITSDSFCLKLELLLYPDRLVRWSRKHHRGEIRACQIMAGRARLILLEGDVGCGKTALAETVGDPLAGIIQGKVHLLKVNTQVRGTGMVGEMTDLIVQAFVQAEARAEALKGEPLLLLIDEADALAATRTEQHMHHEDKAGLNTLLQRIDGLRLGKRRIAVIFITNRPDALDPAIRRRAALRLTFKRPNDDVRTELFRQLLPELALTAKQVKDLVALTGHDAAKKFGAIFTASDITDRLLPAALRDAYAGDRPLTADDLVSQARVMEPTPLMIGRTADDEEG